MRMLMKMQGGAHGDAAATMSEHDVGGDGGGSAFDSAAKPPGSELNLTGPAPSVTGVSGVTATDTWDRPLTVTDGLANGGVVDGKSPGASSAGTPANQSMNSGSDSDAFTPGPDTLLMMEKLKGKHHGHAVLDSVRRSLMPGGGRPSMAGGWGAGGGGGAAASPLPPLGGAACTAFTPNKVTTIAGGPVVNSPMPFGAAGAAAPAFGSRLAAASGGGGGGVGVEVGMSSGGVGGGEGTAAAAAAGVVAGGGGVGIRDDIFTPGAAQRAELHNAKSEQDSRMLGLPFDLPPVPSGLLTDSRPVDLEAFFHACEVSFMEARNLRRKSLAMESLSNAPPPESLLEGLRLVCLTAPMIEALDPMHEHLSEALSGLAVDIDRLRAEVEAAQPPLLRLAASDDPAHVAALQRAGKMLKKECQLAAKDEFTQQRLETERRVRESLTFAKSALERTASSVAQSRDIAAEAAAAATRHEADLRRRVALSADAAARTTAALSTRRGVLTALAERRAHVAKLKETLKERNDEVERLQRRGGEVAAEHSRFSAQLAEARAAAAAEGKGADAAASAADGGASARAAASRRMREAGEAARAVGEELSVLNNITPWRLEGMSDAGGGELTLRVGRLFRVTLNVGTGAGRVTLAESGGVTPVGGCSFAAAVAGAPSAWSEQSAAACNGDLAAVLQSVVPGLRRAEDVLAEAEVCRGAFPRITRMRCTAGGDLELSFTNFAMERKVDVALTMARGAYPRGRLRPRVSVAYAGVGPKLPSATGIEAAIERVPAYAQGRRLFAVCRLVDWLVAKGEACMGEAVSAAAVAANPAPALPAPPPATAVAGGGGGVGGGGYSVLPRVVLSRPSAAAAATQPNVVAAGAFAAASGASSASLTVASSTAAAGAAGAAPGGAMERLAGRITTAAAAAREAVAAAAPTAVAAAAAAAGAAAAAAAAPSQPVPAVTPAGFNKGSNPLFDESMDMMDTGGADAQQ